MDDGNNSLSFLDDFFDDEDSETPEIQPIQIATLICYGVVFLLGVPGNGLVVWVTGFRMPRSVTSQWFLNLALADLLCCLCLPLLMVPLAHDDHWHFGPIACRVIKGLFQLVMYCSVFLLALISVDRWMMVSQPIWCQNHRQPRNAAWACVAVWCLALIASIPSFVHGKQINAGEVKTECKRVYPSPLSGLLFTVLDFLLGFALPFILIVVSHCVVYKRMRHRGSSSGARSKRTLRIIFAVVLTFFLCWLPLHIFDILDVITMRSSIHSPKIVTGQALSLSLAYLNSCLNPLLYVCLGRGFKKNMTRSLRSLFQFVNEEPSRASITKSTRSTNELELNNIAIP